MAVAGAGGELVLAGRRTGALDLAHGAEPAVDLGGLERCLDLGQRAQRVVLAGQDEDPVGVMPLPRLAKAADVERELRPAAPLEDDVVLDGLAAGLFELALVQGWTTRVVPDEDPRRGALFEGSDEPQHLPRV